MTATLDQIFAAIDHANGDDPNSLPAGPRAFVQGRLATKWLAALAPDASPALQIATRAHHLRRWEIARGDYAKGRAGYLQWRRDNKSHQADAAATILDGAGWPADTTMRVGQLLRRTQLRTDSETQVLEDVACLVFLETQFAAMVERTEHDQMVTIVAKTLRKMSAAGIEAAGTLSLTAAGQQIIAEAVTVLDQSNST